MISCPHCAARLTIDERIVSATGGGPCPACGKVLAIKVPSRSGATPVSPQIGHMETPAIVLGRNGISFTGVLAAGAFVVLTGVLVVLQGSWNRPVPAPIHPPGYEDPVVTLLARTKVELEEMQKSLREATKEFIRLEAETEELQQQRETLQREIQNLTVRLDAINKWKHADFIMVNANSFAVGFQQLEDGRFKVIQKADGQSQQDAVRWARKAGRPPIDHDHELTRKIYAGVALDEIVPENLAQEIHRYWCPLRFVPYPPEEKNPPFVVFRDAEHGRRHVGFYLKNDVEQLWFREVAATDDSIPRSRVQIGSVRMAHGEKILSSLSDIDFLDYCVLKTAQNLGSRDGKPAIIRVAVHLEVDALQEEKSLSKVADTRATDELFEFWARLHEKPYPRDARKEPVRLLRELAMYVEDEVYDKLTKLAIPVVERQQIQAVLDESSFGKPLSPGAQEGISQLGATHLLFVDLKKSQEGGPYHLALRLTDVRRGDVIWAQSGERLIAQPNVQQRFQMQTGRLALVTVQAGSQSEFHGVEQPAVALPAFLGVKASREHLVFVEDSVNEESLTYRPLFGVENHEIRSKEIESVTWVTKDTQVPTAHQVRYAVWKMASRILPSAGRALEVQGDNALITLGLRHGVKHHDTLYVLREAQRPAANHFTGDRPAHVLLATTLNVTEIHDEASRVVISGSGLTGWEDDEGLRADDIVITKSGRPVSIAMLAPTWQAPTQKTISRMGLSNAVLAQRTMHATAQTSVAFKNAVGAGLRSVGIPVFTELESSTILTTGATHVFGGYIQPTDSNCYHIDAMIFPLNAKNIGLIRQPKMQMAQLGEELARAEANINLSSLK